MVNKEQIKEEIKDFINNGEINDSFTLVDEYIKTFGFDEEILSMKAILLIYNENYQEAMLSVREGLKYNINSSDLYYTMGNIFEIRGEINKACLCYEQALFLSQSLENKHVINDNIISLKTNFDIQINKISIIMLTYNQLESTQICINSIRKYINMDSYEIIIIDNNSTDGTVEWLKEQKDIKTICNKENKKITNRFFQGLEIANQKSDILLLKNDTDIMPNSIFNLRLALNSDEKIGACGAVTNSGIEGQSVNACYQKFNDYIKYSLDNNIPNQEMYEEKDKLSGFALLIKRKVVNKIGDFEEGITQKNSFSDELSLRIKKEGYRLFVCWDSYIHCFRASDFEDEELISNQNTKQSVKLKFLLRRIEFDIRYNEEDLEVLNSKELSDQMIIKLVEGKIINKCKVLNSIAIFFFNNSQLERVLPYLQKAYDIDSNDDDTLYNLSFVLNYIGEKDLALDYASKIKNINSIVEEPINSIKGE